MGFHRAIFYRCGKRDKVVHGCALLSMAYFYYFIRWIYKNNTPSSANLKLNKNFAPSSSAGRIEKIDDEHILLTVGDFLHDGVNSDQLVQDLSNDYGKILKINISNFSYEIFSTNKISRSGRR